jgi:hypothetical protein
LYENKNKNEFPKITKIDWLKRFIFTSFLMGPVLRYYETFKYGLISRIRYTNSIDEEANARKELYSYLLLISSAMRVMRSVFCSAPLLIFQIYLYGKRMEKGEKINYECKQKNVIQILES